MQHVITAHLHDSISLDEDDAFEVTGVKSIYHTQEKTILVDTVVPTDVYTPHRTEGIRLHGKRILKRGGMSDYRETVELVLTDDQVPVWLRDAVVKLARYRRELATNIADYKTVHGIR